MRKYENLVCRLKCNSIENVLFHVETPLIKRICAKNFPVHLAVHHVSLKKGKNKQNYCRVHTHNEDEINIVISSSDKLLKYKIQLGNEVYVIDSPSAIFIPKNLNHSANFISGDGYFVCLKFPSGIIRQ